MSPKRVLGIDLGTTNSVLAYADLENPSRTHVFTVPQLVSSGEVAERPLLPSLLYADESGDAGDPFRDAPWVVGEYARKRGQQVPGRLVSSAKSWLCHPGVDRRAPILPWGAKEDSDVPRMSPVEASYRVLRHLRATYESAFPDAALEQNLVVLTVPASFDQAARELTVEAAHRAGLSVRLIEEPQAAFYDFVREHGEQALDAVLGASESALVLVCDVGGGTTDLTLIRAKRVTAGGVALERVAVGKHLLLGGDNMDLALAHAIEPRLVEAPGHLDAARFGQLVMACRSAKEQLLAEGAPEAVPIRILSSGAALVGATLSTELDRATVESVVLDGFLPPVARGAMPERTRAALVGFGLPYERDAAITRHLSAFLERHAPDQPLAALFLNGGPFRSARVADRVTEVISALAGRAVTVLRPSDTELAVARGAVAYGLALLGCGVRIEGGASRGYYVGIHPDDSGNRRAVCVVPRGAKEGERHVTAQRLELVVGKPVRFDLYAADRAVHAPGTVVAVEGDDFEPLPPIATELAAGEGRDVVGVSVQGELSPIGTLELSCVELEAAQPGSPPARYRLAFDLRARREPSPSQVPSKRRVSAQRLEEANALVLRAFGKSRSDVGDKEAKNLLRELERLLGERATWTTEVNRALFDLIAPEVKARKRSADHERVFWMLAGYCLRPGYGHPLDERRVGKIAHLFPEGISFKDEARCWQQFFIAWRRVAGGLGEKTQTTIRDTVDPFLAPDEHGLRKPKNFRPQALDEMLSMASVLERVPSERRTELGRFVLERTWTNRDPRLWAAIGRIGARVPTYASLHHVVPPSAAERFLDHLLREKWEEMPSAPRAAVSLARVTGDRSRDVSPEIRAQIEKRLVACKVDPEWVRAVREHVPVAEKDSAEFFGEDLPVGLRLGTALTG